MTLIAQRRLHGQHLPPRAASLPHDPRATEAGYRLLAAEVVKQALRDASKPALQGDVRISINSGALGWWMEVAGVSERTVPRALAAIMARART